MTHSRPPCLLPPSHPRLPHVTTRPCPCPCPHPRPTHMIDNEDATPTGFDDSQDATMATLSPPLPCPHHLARRSGDNDEDVMPTIGLGCDPDATSTNCETRPQRGRDADVMTKPSLMPRRRRPLLLPPLPFAYNARTRMDDDGDATTK